ncbi:MAG: potassium-transporting ATPase subunit KdpA [Actinobacteria bacterium]|nr:potassium-transporting ATPase subunit KdpA [Actinomycetota bacterium]
MTAIGLFQILLFIAILIIITPFLGSYIAKVFQRERTFLDPVMRPVERLIYRLASVDEQREMGWREYTVSAIAIGVLGAVILYVVLRIQGILPLNPQGRGSLSPDLAFNTAISFVTHTNWQAYAGENLAYLTQMMGLTAQNFIAAGTAMGVAAALIRGFARKTAETVGNFWVDMTRSILWVLLPLALVFAIFLVSQGVIQNLSPYVTVKTLEGTSQSIAMGPVASQEAIKILGTNGGGFFNANAAHPFENPTPLTNFLQAIAMLAIPAALTYAFGKMVGNARQGWALFAAMMILLTVGVITVFAAEQGGNPLLTRVGVDQAATSRQGGGNMEGKEVRFGPFGSALYANATTAAAVGSVNSSHDSFTPIGGSVLMFNMMLSEVVFGGVGAGLFTMLIFAVVAVFIAGLMVGRTPEYIGKKIEAKEMKMAMLVVLIFPATILILTALAVMTGAGKAGIFNPGPHGFSEILYGVTSAAANNGSAFGGLKANSQFYNVLLGISMMIGRFAIIVPVLAIAGSLASKKAVPESAGTFPTTRPLFVGLLIGVVIIVGALTFFPALALGPFVEQLLMKAGITF